MMRHRSKQSVVLVGLVVLAAALGLRATSAGATPPPQEPYPPPCPCSLVIVTAKSVVSPGECTTITCRLTDGAGSPAVGVDCTLSIASQPGSGATLSPGSATSDENGEANAQLCVGSTAGSIVVKGETECCQGQVQVTVQAPPVVAAETATPAAPPATGSGTSGSNSWPIPLIALCSATLLAAAALLVWRTGVRRRQSS